MVSQSKLRVRSVDVGSSSARWRAALAIVFALLVAGSASAGTTEEDDIFLFTSSVSPNVLFLLDNSGSMNEIVWHPNYDPAAAVNCAVFNPAFIYGVGGTGDFTFCGRTRRLYHDSTSIGNTRYSGGYLNWIFSSSNTVQAEINTNNNGVRLCGTAGPATYAKYQRNRLFLAKRIVLDTMCDVLATKSIRFGLAVFRDARDAGGVDPNGGHVEVPINDDSSTHRTNLETSVLGTVADSWTPLGESLYQLYTYFMSRTAANLPAPATSGAFATYEYVTSPALGGGLFTTTASQRPDSPIQFTCQKNFVVIVTDGFSTRDDFDQDPADTSRGFAAYNTVIGDFNGEGEVETGYPSEGTRYLDDIAKFMHERDCRPDLSGNQLLDVYTIGFTTDADANDLLMKTAVQGNGLFYSSKDPDDLRVRLAQAVNDILEKAQSFTAATVPSTRTTAGGSFYQSFFLPSAKTPFWEGHLRSFRIDAVGDIFGQSDVCAFIDPTAGECNSGPQNPAATPFWDAGSQVPLPGVRKLYTSKVSSGTPARVAFDLTLTAADLSIPAFASTTDPSPNPIYAGSAATTNEGLADEVVSYGRGCAFGSGVTAGGGIPATVACNPRSWRLGDIFHSGPAVITRPRSTYPDPSYVQFKATYANRIRVAYAGANDGFLHAFHAGTVDTSTTPHSYTHGTGVELFGFMPWEARRNIKRLYVDDPINRTYYVDGSPQVIDTWFRSSATDTSKSSSEWKSVLVGGLRQGGRAYYALDVTDPSAAGYPGYLWEFPNETDPNTTTVSTSILPYLGESWSNPVVTRVKVRIDSDDNSGVGYERWVMVVSGGYDPTGDPNDHASYNATGIRGRAILMVDMKTGELLAMKRYDTSATDAQANMTFSIPATPAVVDLNNDGFADVIYVGDLGGQVFKWVVKAIGEDRVNDSSTAGTYTQPSWPFKRFFTAPVTTVGTTSYYKSFFFPPQLTYVGRRVYVAFGSGERMNVGFVGLSGQDENNRFYTMTDLDPLELASTPYATLTESDLTDLSTDLTGDCSSVTNRGFYFKTVDGEKFVTNAEIFNRYVFAGSFVPSTSGDPCSSKGSGKLYAFRVDCGQTIFLDPSGNPSRSVDIGEGLPTDPQISVGVNGKDNRIYIEKSGADLESIGAEDLDVEDGSIIYWRERN